MSSFLMRRVTSAPSALRAFSTTSARPLARLTVTGRLGSTPELQASSTGKEFIKYSVATDHGSKDNRKTSWFHVTLFDPSESARDRLNELPKGTLVVVEGDAVMNQYQDAEGKNRSSLSIYQRSLEVLSRPRPTEADE